MIVPALPLWSGAGPRLILERNDCLLPWLRRRGSFLPPRPGFESTAGTIAVKFWRGLNVRLKKVIIFAAVCLAAGFILRIHIQDKDRESNDQTFRELWETLSYSTPVEMSVFADIDSIPWEIKDQPTLNWFYENFNNLEILYEEGSSRDGRAAFSDERSLYVLIACEDGNGFSLMVNPEGKLLISENTTISSENIETPPAGIYSIESEFDFEAFWDISRKQRVP